MKKKKKKKATSKKRATAMTSDAGYADDAGQNDDDQVSAENPPPSFTHNNCASTDELRSLASSQSQQWQQPQQHYQTHNAQDDASAPDLDERDMVTAMAAATVSLSKHATYYLASPTKSTSSTNDPTPTSSPGALRRSLLATHTFNPTMAPLPTPVDGIQRKSRSS